MTKENEKLKSIEWVEDAMQMGFISFIFGAAILLLGVPLKADWFGQNNYVLNAPVLVFVSFLVVGAILNFAAFRKVRSQQQG